MPELQLYITNEEGVIDIDFNQIAPENRPSIALLADCFCIGGLPSILGLLSNQEVEACKNTLTSIVESGPTSVDLLVREIKKTLESIPEDRDRLTLKAAYLFDAAIPAESIVPHNSYPSAGKIRRNEFEMADLFNVTPETAVELMEKSARCFTEQAIQKPIYHAFGKNRFK